MDAAQVNTLYACEPDIAGLRPDLRPGGNKCEGTFDLFAECA